MPCAHSARTRSSRKRPSSRWRDARRRPAPPGDRGSFALGYRRIWRQLHRHSSACSASSGVAGLSLPISAIPTASRPTSSAGASPTTPPVFARYGRQMVEAGMDRRGCCGTTPAHIGHRRACATWASSRRVAVSANARTKPGHAPGRARAWPARAQVCGDRGLDVPAASTCLPHPGRRALRDQSAIASTSRWRARPAAHDPMVVGRLVQGSSASR